MTQTAEPTLAQISRDEAIKRIRAALRKRSGKAWSVRGGSGTAHGWITIDTPPRRSENGYMPESERHELAALLGMDRPVHFQGHKIPASTAYYIEYVDRAEGHEPRRFGKRYWD